MLCFIYFYLFIFLNNTGDIILISRSVDHIGYILNIHDLIAFVGHYGQRIIPRLRFYVFSRFIRDVDPERGKNQTIRSIMNVKLKSEFFVYGMLIRD